MQANTAEDQSQSETLPGWQLGKNLGTCLRELYDQKLWTDVKFRCKDHDHDERIYAHKTILAAISPVFQAMFFGAFTENKEEIQLGDAEKRIFDLFLKYVYSDKVTLEDDTASELLQIAHLYQVPGLVQLCAEYLATIIRTENACEILTIALFYNISSLKNACCSFIDQNAQSILNSEAFMDLKEDGLLHILKGDTFKADEEEIFFKAEEWSIKKLKGSGLEQNGDNIRKTLEGSFYQLRLPTMSYQTLVKCTRDKGYLSVDEYMNIADFINGIPDTSVRSNSCIARIPVNESLIMKEAESEESMRHHSLSASFDIHVRKDVELLSVGVHDIELCLWYDHCINPSYKGRITTWDTELVDLFKEYADKVIKLEKENRGSYRNRKRTVYEYKELSELKLPKGLYPLLHGSISIKGLNFRHDFKLDTSQTTKAVVHLKQPLKLKSADKPYSVDIEIKYRCCILKSSPCDHMLQMRVKGSRFNGNVKSRTCHVEVFSQQYHTFIDSINFQNCANLNQNL